MAMATMNARIASTARMIARDVVYGDRIETKSSQSDATIWIA